MRKKLVLLVLIAACCIVSTWASKPALAAPTYRNIYGYVFGLGTATGAISRIDVYDSTAKVHYGNARWEWYGYNLGVAGLRWYCNSLPTNHSYTVTVYPNGFEEQAQSKSFYLPYGYYNDQKIADFNFHLTN